MNRRVAKKVDARISREVLASVIHPERVARTLYRGTTRTASARVLVRDLSREGYPPPPPPKRLPYVPPSVVDLGRLGELFRGVD